MWLDFYWRWRYGRLQQKLPELRRDPMRAIAMMYDLYRRLHIEDRTYRQRVEQRLAIKTVSVTELTHLLYRINNLIAIESRYTDSLFVRYRDRQVYQLDSWLIDDGDYPVEEIDAQRYLSEQINKLLHQMNLIHQRNPSLYEYYNHNLYYAVADSYYALDALIALQLRISPNERIAALPLKPL